MMVDKDGSKWLELGEGPEALDKLEQIVKENRKALDNLLAASRCSRCTWETAPPLQKLAGYRNLARLAAVEMTVAMARKQHDRAGGALYAGYSIASALTAEGTQLLHGLVGVAIADLMDERLQLLIQQPELPPVDLSQLPALLPAVNRQAKAETDAARNTAANPAIAAAQVQQLKATHERALALATRAERRIEAGRAIECLRQSLTNHQGVLPQSLPSPGPTMQPIGRATSKQAGTTGWTPALTYKRTSPNTATISVKVPDERDATAHITYRITVEK